MCHIMPARCGLVSRNLLALLAGCHHVVCFTARALLLWSTDVSIIRSSPAHTQLSWTTFINRGQPEKCHRFFSQMAGTRGTRGFQRSEEECMQPLCEHSLPGYVTFQADTISTLGYRASASCLWCSTMPTG